MLMAKHRDRRASLFNLYDQRTIPSTTFSYHNCLLLPCHDDTLTYDGFFFFFLNNLWWLNRKYIKKGGQLFWESKHWFKKLAYGGHRDIEGASPRGLLCFAYYSLYFLPFVVCCFFLFTLYLYFCFSSSSSSSLFILLWQVWALWSSFQKLHQWETLATLPWNSSKTLSTA